MILTVTANPLLDRYLSVDEIRTGRIHRGREVREWVGGKGVNASRAVLTLGGETLATGFLGGYTGDRIRALLDEENIPHDFIRIAAQTRQGLSIRHPDSGLTAFYDPPAPVREREFAAFEQRFGEWLDRAGFCIISGSMPGNGRQDFYSRLIARCRQKRVPVLLDTYGAPLKTALTAGADFIKVNRDEVRQTFADSAEEQRDDAFARIALEHGSRFVLITDGAHPCRFYQRKGILEIIPARVREVNPLGSGDCVAAGIALGMSRGQSVRHALVLGLAAGAANAETPDPAVFQRQRAHQLMGEIVLKDVSRDFG